MQMKNSSLGRGSRGSQHVTSTPSSEFCQLRLLLNTHHLQNLRALSTYHAIRSVCRFRLTEKHCVPRWNTWNKLYCRQ